MEIDDFVKNKLIEKYSDNVVDLVKRKENKFFDEMVSEYMEITWYIYSRLNDTKYDREWIIANVIEFLKDFELENE